MLRFLDLLLYTSVLTACCASALCMATECLVTAGPPPPVSPLHLLIFGGTLVVYNMPRIVPQPYGRRRLPHTFTAAYYFFFSAGAAITLLAFSMLSVQVCVLAAVLSVFAFAYFLPLLPFKNKKRLRDTGLLKIGVLAGVWTTATAALPILYLQKNVAAYPVEILLRFVFIFSLCVVFDIRDMRADLRNNIVTLPNRVGLENSYRLIHGSLFLFALLSIVQYTKHPVDERLAGALLTAAVTSGVVRYLRRRPTERGYLLLADGVMVLYSLLVIY